MWVAVGSRDEGPGEGGISHFLEHLLFKGTHVRSSFDIAEAFDAVGAESNAATTKEATYYWNQRTRKDPRRYPGPKPLSEPESRWVFNEMDQWKPDLIVSVHAPYGLLDFDGPTAPPQRLGRLYLDQVGIFPGSLGNYGGVHKKVPVVTIELPSA